MVLSPGTEHPFLLGMAPPYILPMGWQALPQSQSKQPHSHGQSNLWFSGPNRVKRATCNAPLGGTTHTCCHTQHAVHVCMCADLCSSHYCLIPCRSLMVLPTLLGCMSLLAIHTTLTNYNTTVSLCLLALCMTVETQDACQLLPCWQLPVGNLYHFLHT
jgi:hypothetical protein